MRANHWIVIALSLLFAGCGPLSVAPEPAAHVVRWGTSFGMCAGYCREDLVVDSTQVSLTRRGWPSTALPPTVEEKTMSRAAWLQLAQSLDAATVHALNDVYGCPDCADGGAEYLEMQTAEFTKRVTFEYGAGPDELQPALQQLRVLRASFPAR